MNTLALSSCYADECSKLQVINEPW